MHGRLGTPSKGLAPLFEHGNGFARQRHCHRRKIMQTEPVPQGATLLRATFILKTHFAVLLSLLFTMAVSGQSPATNGPSRLLSVEGRVEVARSGLAAWKAGTTNQVLQNGDRVRTGVRSRAMIQLSDRSLLRVNELTTLEVRPPQAAGASAGFEMKSGAGYFFNRERPGSVEFRTPLASGAIRGTEFNLLVAENGRTELALLDGLVELTNDFGVANLASGEQGVVEPGQPPRQSPLLDASSIIQWVLYYPAILDVDEAGLSSTEISALTDSITAYRAGDLLAALDKYPENRPPGSDAERVYRAATLLAVGQVAQSTQLIQNVSSPLAGALRSLVQTVKGSPISLGTSITLASEWMAESYAQQARSKLNEALAAARQATIKAPQFGFAWERLAELEFSLGHPDAARAALEKSLALAPCNAQTRALQGFLLAAKGKFAFAEQSFAQAIALDPALANGWLGRGLVRIRRGEAEPGRLDLQVAATREPGRSLLHSYLGKAWFHAGDSVRAEKEIKLAQRLDPGDPTPWLYAAVLAGRNCLYDQGIYRSEAGFVPLINVGNLRVGGTGKTPHVARLVAELLRQGQRPAILSRGYGRRTRGPRLATPADSASTVLTASPSFTHKRPRNCAASGVGWAANVFMHGCAAPR